MEDEVQAHFNEAGGYLYAAVFDGHGGEAAAQWLGQNLHLALDTNIAGLQGDALASSSDPTHSESLTSTFQSVFQRVDSQLIQHLKGFGENPNAQAGATATVVVLKDNRVLIANVGDSQAVICRRGLPVEMAHTHRVYGNGPDVQAEMARVRSTGGWVDDGRVCGVLAVSRAFGDWEFKGEGLPHLLANGVQKGYWNAEFASQQTFSSDPVVCAPDVTTARLTPGDEFLVIASDGLWDVMPPREVVTWARKEFRAKASAKAVAAGLTELALKRYSTDNVAVVVVDLMGLERRSAKPAKKPLFGGMFSGKK